MKDISKFIITISPKSIALFTLIPLAIYLLWIVKDILFSLLIGFILMSALRPAVQYLSDRKVPRTIAVFIVYLTFILIFILLISLIIPPIIAETASLIRSFPIILEQVAPQLGMYVDLRDVTAYIPNVTNNIFGIVSGIFSNALFLVTTMFFGLYFLLEEKVFYNFVGYYFSQERAARITAVIKKAEQRMSSWFWGQITLMIVVGLLTFVGLNILGVKYALPLAVLAGLLEIVPNIGPTIAAVPAIIIGLSMSYFTGFSVLALSIIIQQMENSLIVPYIMRKAVGINPIFTLISLLVGGRIGGVLGVLLAIPLFLFIETILSQVLNLRISPTPPQSAPSKPQSSETTK